uniref:Genome polyprotein n=1 Tax=Guangxi houndshark hepacivirus TaxID=2116375 RepID=A0A2P1GN68_9FLAV|nr:polyprotein [Guangxi houndshark hepacivirus]
MITKKPMHNLPDLGESPETGVPAALEQWGQKPTPRLLRTVARLAKWRRSRLLTAVVEKARASRQFLYHHLGHVPKEMLGLSGLVSVDPVSFKYDPTTVVIKDESRFHWCGDSCTYKVDDTIHYLPVVYRNNDDYCWFGVTARPAPAGAWLAAARRGYEPGSFTRQPGGGVAYSRGRERYRAAAAPERRPQSRSISRRPRPAFIGPLPRPRSRSRSRSRKRPQQRAKSNRSRNWFARHAYGGGIYGVDWALQRAAQLAVPEQKNWQHDPRKRARNLGRVIDGATGWLADVGMALPGVWPVTGYTARMLAHIIRGVEDVINAGTGLVGLQLFIIMVVLLPVPTGALPSRVCKLPNGTHTITNVCNQEDLSFCTYDMCWHAPGCVVATDVCWKSYNPTLSHHPNHSTPLSYFADHLDMFTVATYTCEITGIGSYCFAALFVIDYGASLWPHTVITNCSLPCGKAIEESEILTLWDSFADGNPFLEVAAYVIYQVPWLIHMLFSQLHIGILFVSVAYVIEGKWPRVVLLFCLYGSLHTAAAAQCNLSGQRKHRCFLPDFNWVRELRPHRAAGWRGPCINPEFQPCDLGYPDPDCRGDNFTFNPAHDLKKCNWGHVLSKCVHATNTSNATDHALRAGFIRFQHRLVGFKCVCTPHPMTRMPGAPHLHRRRVPWFPLFGVPVTTSGSRTVAAVCPGHAFLVGVTGTTAVQLSSPHEQVFTNLEHTHLLALLERTIFLFSFAQFVGARVLGLLYLLSMLVLVQGALDCSGIVALAASPLVSLDPFALVCVWYVLMAGPRVTTKIAAVVLMWAYRAKWLTLVVVAAAVWTPARVLGAPIAAVTPINPAYPIIFLVVGFCCLPFFRFKQLRLAAAWHVQYMYSLIEIATEALCVGTAPPGAVIVTTLAVYAVGLSHYACYALYILGFAAVVDILAYCITCTLLPSDRYRLVDWLSSVIMQLPEALAKALGTCMVWKLEAYRVYMYDHIAELGPSVKALAGLIGAALDPFCFPTDQVEYIQDSARAYACYDVINGKPVVARCGDSLLLGVPRGGLPAGYEKTLPVAARVVSQRGFFRTLAISIVGKDAQTHAGQVCVLRSALSSSMAYGCNGVLYTTTHGAKGRTLASLESNTPIVSDAKTDVSTYPLPAGMTCLTACTCPKVNGYLLTKAGTFLEARFVVDHHWNLTVPAPVAVLRGSSGSPLVCPKGHAIGTFRAAAVAKGMGTAISVVPVDTPLLASTVDPSMGLPSLPTVPETYEVREFVAPTGSGKSTVAPLTYVKAGKRVLVLNPSVATTAAIPPYMKATHDIAPNWHCGVKSVVTGSPLTYATYGKFLAMGPELLAQADVVFCDECHATDATAVLGISLVLDTAERAGVKLVLLATATPPGCNLVAHPNIQEHQLSAKGDIPFYGSSLESERYATGRHLVFCDTKKMCETVANNFKAAGIMAVTYWRGEDITVIPPSGDVVVVATNALMTGYSGSFHSVTDCCCEVVASAAIDFQPTVTLSVRSQLTTVVSRMQRRGRTGRGEVGNYYFTHANATPSGIVPLAIVLEVYDMALCWYGISPDRVTTLLAAYANQPLLPSCRFDPDTVGSFFTSFAGYAQSADVARAKREGHSFPLLTGAQVAYNRESGFTLPTTPRFEGYGVEQNEETCITLYNLDGPVTNYVTDNTRIQQLQACLGMVETDMSLSLGLSLAAGMLAVAVITDNVGSLVVGDTFLIRQEIPPPRNYTPPDDVLFECVEGWDLGGAMNLGSDLYAKFKTAVVAADIPAKAASLRDAAAAAVSPMLGITPKDEPLAQKFLTLLGEHASSIMSAAQMLGGFAVLSRSPLMGGALLGTGFYLLPVSIPGRFYLAMLAGGLGTWLATPQAGFTAALGSFAGLALAESGFGSIVFSGFGTWAAASTAASITFDLLAGKYPTKEEMFALISILLNPGAAVVGVVMGGILSTYVAKGNHDWMNRLLAMAVRGNVLPPGYFVEGATARDKVGIMLKGLTPGALLAASLRWAKEPTVVAMSSSWVFDYIWEIVCAMVRWTKATIHNAVTALEPKIPLLSCSKPYTAGLAGTGSINTVCPCGAALAYSVNEGRAVCTYASRVSCRGYWCSGVILNSNTQILGTVCLAPRFPYDAVVPSGLAGLYTVTVRSSGYTMRSSTSSNVYVSLTGPPPLSSCIFINGAPTMHYESSYRKADHMWGSGAVVIVNGEEVTLPHIVEYPTNLTNIPMNTILPNHHLAERPPTRDWSDFDDDHASLCHVWNGARGEEKNRCQRDCPDLPQVDVVEDYSFSICRMMGGNSRARLHGDVTTIPVESNRAGFIHDPSRPPQSGLPCDPVQPPQSPPEDMPALESDSDGDLGVPSSAFTIAQVHRPGTGYVNEAFEMEEIKSQAQEDEADWESLSGSITTARSEIDLSPTPPGSESIPMSHMGESEPAVLECGGVDDCGSHASVGGMSAVFTPGSTSEPLSVHRSVSFAEIPTVVDIPTVRRRRDSLKFQTMSESYIWNGTPLLTRWMSVALNPVAASAYYFGANRGRIYATDPDRIAERAKKVTFDRPERTEFTELNEMYTKAHQIASTLKLEPMGLKEACESVPPHSATSCVTGHTAEDVRTMKPSAVKAIKEATAALGLPEGNAELQKKWLFTTIMPKVEWFVRRPGGSMKPPRLIMYPPLEVRVAEKRFLGNIAPEVCKAVMKEAYGFDKTPKERATFVVNWWNTHKQAVVFSADALCFDSQITEEDMAREAEIFAAAAKEPAIARAILECHKRLYMSSPIERPDRTVVGTRNCRASGVYTTSAGNTLTAWMKMRAGLKQAGFRDSRLMVCGDDVIVVAASDGPEIDKAKAHHLTECLGAMGLVQGSTIEPQYDLERVATCSNYISVAYTKTGERPYYFLSPDPTKCLGRCMVETPQKKALNTWLSALVMYYPTFFASRVLATAFMRELIKMDVTGATVIEFTYNGNKISTPLRLLPGILVNLHGLDVFSLKAYSTKHVGDTIAALQYLGYKPLKYWRAETKRVFIQCLKLGGVWNNLAYHLLWHATDRPPISTISQQTLELASAKRITSIPPYSNVEVGIVPKQGWPDIIVYHSPVLFALGVAAVVLTITAAFLMR